MVNSRVETAAVAVTGGSGGAVRSCAGCGGRISDRFLLFSMDRYWHTRCLKCSCCQAQLGEIGSTCFSKGGMILCKNDYIRLFGHSGACSACGQSIPASEMVMRAQGNVYHLKCFTCATCRNRLVPGDRFHYVNGTIFCEHDRPGGALLSSHLTPLQSNTLLPDQKVCWENKGFIICGVPSLRIFPHIFPSIYHCECPPTPKMSTLLSWIQPELRKYCGSLARQSPLTRETQSNWRNLKMITHMWSIWYGWDGLKPYSIKEQPIKAGVILFPFEKFLKKCCGRYLTFWTAWVYGLWKISLLAHKMTSIDQKTVKTQFCFSGGCL